MSETKKSPWIYVGFGCGAIVLIAIVAAGGTGFMAYRKVKQFGEELKDPVAREAKAKAILGASALPPGYYAVMSLSIPYVMDMAFLSDQPPKADGTPDPTPHSRMLAYMRFLKTAENAQELEDYFSGKTDDPAVLQREGINMKMQTREVLGRGVIELTGKKLLYLSQRGNINMSGPSGATNSNEGINALILVTCPNDQKMRFALWTVPDPDPNQPAGNLDLTGTPGDESAIRTMFEPFALCQ